MSRTVKLTLGFIGTRYEGWQSQKKDRTLQEILEKSLQKILGERTDLVSSSRTDSGVHARGLVAHFKTRSKLPDLKLKAALNFYLPADVAVCSSKTVSPDFHARYHAKSKVYQYDIWVHPTRPLFEAPYVLWLPKYRLNVSLMKKAARHLIGRHDFSAFRDKGGEERDPVRRIHRLSVQKKGPLVRIEVEGDGFLTHMVRIIAGTLIEVGRGKMLPETIPSILKSKDRSKAGPTAKAHALTLLRVRY